MLNGVKTIVLTSQAEKYKNKKYDFDIEFYDLEAEELIKKLETRGVGSVLICGGGETNKNFLQKDLFDEIIVDIEP